MNSSRQKLPGASWHVFFRIFDYQIEMAAFIYVVKKETPRPRQECASRQTTKKQVPTKDPGENFELASRISAGSG
jgi:hypothetical protein